METLLHNLVQATGWSILHSLWQSALIYALLLPFQMKVFGLNARQKYAMAYGSICLMFASFVFTFNLAFHWSTEIASQNFAVPAIVLPTALPANLAHYVEMVFPYLVLFYSLGLIGQSLIVIQGYRKVQSLKKRAYTIIPESWNTLFQNLKIELNIEKEINFRLSDHVSVPLVIGFFKPVILFPIALAAQMDLKQVETILIHELSHIRRNDYFFNLVKTMIDTILFFNPFVWLAGRFINIEREHACDDLVVKVTHTPLTYAHALLTLELITDKSSPVLALAATGTNQHLYQRIKRITDMKTTYANSKQKLFAVTLTFATIISLAWINPSKKEKTVSTVPHTKDLIQKSSEICFQDTTKKKNRKQFKIVNTDSVYVPAPNAPAAPEKTPVAPVAPIAPAAPGNVAAPKAPKTPVAPELADLDVNVSPLTDVIVNFSDNVMEMTMAHFNGKNPDEIKKMQAEIQKKGAELQRKFNSPEQKAKWEKIGAEMKAKYDSPQEKAKWEKFAKEAELHAQKMMNDPEFKKNLQKITITRQQPMKIVIENEDTRKLKESPEYLELKKKFDRDVEDLLNKKNKKDEN
ncbi:MAG: M56 family metallopeptidase [Pedobacter sp.]|uniref:M56 family metallopeptidase n=1 Tax=Pedobacter sp. TaxID=1411316 RepID=UPI003397E0F2